MNFEEQRRNYFY